MKWQPPAMGNASCWTGMPFCSLRVKLSGVAQLMGHTGACCHRRTMDWPSRLGLASDPSISLFYRCSIRASAAARMTEVIASSGCLGCHVTRHAM